MDLPGLTIILDAPDQSGGDDGSWIQIAKKGTFSDPRYGKFKIDQRYYDKWLSNFIKLDPEGVAIDEDHSPEKGEGTKAVGWVKALEQRGKELWAKVKFNSRGHELIGDEVYKFLSPSYKEDFVDEEGNHHGTKLMGIALTNRPFLTMATVTLTRAETGFIAEEIEESPTADSPRQMTPELLKALGLEDGADDAKVLEAAQALAAKAAKADEEPAPAAADKTLDQQLKDAGMVALSADTVLQLQQDASEGKAAAASLRETRFTTAWSKALSEGQVTPAEEETYKALYDVEADKTLAAIDARPKIVNTEAAGSGGETAAGGGAAFETKTLSHLPVDEAQLELHNKAIALMQTENIEDYEVALDKVLAQGATV